MPLDTTRSPIAGGEEFPAYGPAENFQAVIREKVTTTASAASIALSRKLPPRCQVLFASLMSATSIVNGTQTAIGGTAATSTATVTADRYALLFSTASTYPTATQNGSAAVILLGPTGTVSNTQVRGICIQNTNLANTSTVDWYMHLIPYSTATGTYATNISPPTAATQTTAGLRFGTTAGGVDVQVQYQRFITDTPNRT